MELVVTFKQSDSAQSNFTYTTSECRLKLCKNDAEPINTPMIKFCELLMEYFNNIKFPLSLRGNVREANAKFFIKLCQSKRHIDIDRFYVRNNNSNLLVEDIYAKELQEHTHQPTL